MSIKNKFEKINLEKLKTDSPQAYNVLKGWADSTSNFTEEKSTAVVEPLFNKLYDKLSSGKFWYVIEGNKQPKGEVAEPITPKEEKAIVKEVVKSEPKQTAKTHKSSKGKSASKSTAKKQTSASAEPSAKPKRNAPKLKGKSVFEIAKELRAKDSTLSQQEAVRMAGKMVKEAHNKAKDEELQSLIKMIKSDPKYSVMKSVKNTSILRDLSRPAITTTKRVSHKGWKNQYGASDGGRTYYENRVNRMDVSESPMYAKGGNIDGKMSFAEFEKTLQEYEVEGGFGKRLEKGYKMYYLPKGDPMLNTKFPYRNKRKAYQEYLKIGKYSKGGSVHGKHLPTSEVSYTPKTRIEKLKAKGIEISEDDIISGVFSKKKYAKGGKLEELKVGTGASADGDTWRITHPKVSGIGIYPKKLFTETQAKESFIKEHLSGNDSSKKDYIYIPKSEISSIEYIKDGESVIAKNSDILDGAYIKSASKFAKGGRLPKDEVVYIKKSDIEDIEVVDSGFKKHDITEDLLSGIHVKASAFKSSPKPTAVSSSKGAKFGKTSVYKGFQGWTARTSVMDANGKDYEIVTMKRSNGKLWSNAQQGKFERGMFTFMMYQDPNMNLVETSPSKVTEKAVSEQHEKAISVFKEKIGL